MNQEIGCAAIPSKFCLLLHVLSLLNETLPSKVHTSPIQVNNATVNRCNRGLHDQLTGENRTATVMTWPVSHTVKNTTDEPRLVPERTASVTDRHGGRAERHGERQSQRGAFRRFELKAGSFSNRRRSGRYRM